MQIYQTFSGLFDSSDDVGNDEQQYQGETESARRKRIREDLEAERQHRKWQWFQMIYRLADGDPLRFSEITKLNMIFVFNFLSFELENKKLVSNIRTKPVVTMNQ